MIKGRFVQKRNGKLVYLKPFQKVNSQLSIFEPSINNQEINKRIVFDGGNDMGAESFRIPSSILLNNGELISFAQVQYAGASDYTNQEIGSARSGDFGKTWHDKQVIAAASNTDSRMLNPTFIYDEKENKIIMIVTEIFSTSETLWWTNDDADWDIYTF
ncbi:MAG: glycoside hydrolase, partial [Tetragenococcus koreensis]|nr:glycoside hydrolase [Tetragenococcus koreensis]